MGKSKRSSPARNCCFEFIINLADKLDPISVDLRVNLFLENFLRPAAPWRQYEAAFWQRAQSEWRVPVLSLSSVGPGKRDRSRPQRKG